MVISYPLQHFWGAEVVCGGGSWTRMVSYLMLNNVSLNNALNAIVDVEQHISEMTHISNDLRF